MVKKSCNCIEKIKSLKKDIERLTEENLNYETISKSHKETNGKLQTELTEAQNKIKDFEENYANFSSLKADNDSTYFVFDPPSLKINIGETAAPKVFGRIADSQTRK